MKPLKMTMGRIFTGFVLCGFAVVSLSACDIQFGRKSKGDDDSDKKVVEVVYPVEASTPHRGNISAYFETTTRVEAERRVDVSARGSARCLAVFVEEGDEVEAGDVLAELEKDEARATYRQAEVQVRQNNTAYRLAKRQYEQGLGAKMEMDNAQYTYEQSLATLESQRIQLDNLTIRSPIDGIVTARVIQQGMLTTPSQHVFTISDPTSFMLAIAVPEKELSRLEVGQAARVSIDALRGREFDARVRRISPSVDPVSGTVKVVLDFDDEVQQLLRESAFARVKLVMATRQNVLLVPKEAIVEEAGRKFIFVVREREKTADEASDAEIAKTAEDAGSTKDEGAKLLTPEVEASAKDLEEGEDASSMEGVAERVEVRTGLEDSRYVQVYFGLKDGDLMITNGQYTLKDGAIVRVTTTADDVRAKAGMDTEEALDAAKKRREEGGSPDDAARGRNRRRIH